jgi:Flp pilus assembly secretin CpaC
MRTFARLLIVSFGTIVFCAIAQAQQIHIKVRFFEVPKETLAELKAISDVTTDATEILTADATATLLQEFNTNYRVAHLAEPEVVTTSGRQTQIRATIIRTIVTNSALQESSTNNATVNNIVFETKVTELGPIINVIPFVSSDGQKIELTTTASDTKFFGYADPKKSSARFATNSIGQKITLPVILPVLQENRASAKISVSDGRTLILFLKADAQQDKYPQYIKDQFLLQDEKKNGEKFLVALITPTLVDSAGNRIHSDN